MMLKGQERLAARPRRAGRLLVRARPRSRRRRPSRRARGAGWRPAPPALDHLGRRGRRTACAHRHPRSSCARLAGVEPGASGATATAGAQRAQEHRRVVHARCGADRDGVAGRQAVALQAGGDAVHQRVEPRVVQRAIGVGQGGPVGRLLRRGWRSGRRSGRNRAGWRLRSCSFFAASMDQQCGGCAIHTRRTRGGRRVRLRLFRFPCLSDP